MGAVLDSLRCVRKSHESLSALSARHAMHGPIALEDEGRLKAVGRELFPSAKWTYHFGFKKRARHGCVLRADRLILRLKETGACCC